MPALLFIFNLTDSKSQTASDVRIFMNEHSFIYQTLLRLSRKTDAIQVVKQ